MSFQAMAWAWRQIDRLPSAHHLIVLMAISDYATDEGLCYPSQETLGRKTKLSERTIRGIMWDLESEGLISRKKRMSAEGRKPDLIYLTVQPADFAPWVSNRQNTSSQPANLAGNPISKNLPEDSREDSSTSFQSPHSPIKVEEQRKSAETKPLTGLELIKKEIFDETVSALADQNKKPNAARAIVGGWIKRMGEAAIIELQKMIRRSVQNASVDHVAYVEGQIQHWEGKRAFADGTQRKKIPIRQFDSEVFQNDYLIPELEKRGVAYSWRKPGHLKMSDEVMAVYEPLKDEMYDRTKPW